MEYYKDFVIRPKNKWIYVVGAIIGIIYILKLIFTYLEKETVTVFDWICFTLFMLSLMLNLSNAIWYHIGKAFIRIDNEGISVKADIRKPEIQTNWNDISKINYHFGKFIIEKKDAHEVQVPFSNLDFNTVQELKQILSGIANEKNVLHDIS